jgi:hypothetical protein
MGVVVAVYRIKLTGVGRGTANEIVALTDISDIRGKSNDGSGAKTREAFLLNPTSRTVNC